MAGTFPNHGAVDARKMHQGLPSQNHDAQLPFTPWNFHLLIGHLLCHLSCPLPDLFRRDASGWVKLGEQGKLTFFCILSHQNSTNIRFLTMNTGMQKNKYTRFCPHHYSLAWLRNDSSIRMDIRNVQ